MCTYNHPRREENDKLHRGLVSSSEPIQVSKSCLNIFPYWHGVCCVATQKRDWDNKICVVFLFFVKKTHVSGWIAILFNFVPANGRSLQMQSRRSFCASPLWLFVVGSGSWGETRTRAIETQKDEKSKNGHLFYYNKGVYFWNLDTRCTGEAPNVRC